MNEELAKYFEDKAKEMGISASALMVVALKQYHDQQETLKGVSGMNDWLGQLRALKEDYTEK